MAFCVNGQPGLKLFGYEMGPVETKRESDETAGWLSQDENECQKQIGNLMNGLDVVNFFERVQFSFLTGNGDMHLKNFILNEA